MSMNPPAPDHAASSASEAGDTPASGCVNAMHGVATWQPLPDEAVTLIIGLCGCTETKKFPAATLVIQRNVIVLFGGLHEEDVNAFKAAVAAKPISIEFEFDGRSKDVVVPCPPPNVNLTDVVSVVLKAAAQVPGADLTEVFTMGTRESTREREKTPA